MPNNRYFFKRMAVTAMMTALEIVLSRFLSFTTPLMKVGIGFLSIAVVAILYGPVYAGAAWALADFLGAVMFPVGPFFYGFTVSAALNGVIFGVFLHNDFGKKIWRPAAAALISGTAVAVGLDSVWLSMLSGNPLGTVLTWRLIRSAVMIPLQFALIFLLKRYFGKALIGHGSAAMRKRELRKEALEYYRGEFQKDRTGISARIAAKLAAEPRYQTAKTVFCYVGRDTEIDTSVFIKTAIADGKTVAVPLCGPKGDMSARLVRDIGELRPGRFGILEPIADSEEVPPEEIDMAVLPSLVCDEKGRRVGFGGGYYDRYIEGKKLFSVILCPRAMIKKRVPNASFDARGNMVVSE